MSVQIASLADLRAPDDRSGDVEEYTGPTPPNPATLINSYPHRLPLMPPVSQPLRTV